MHTLILAVTLFTIAQASAEGIDLPHGPHRVGFLNAWAYDHSRTYSTTFDHGTTYGNEKSPRPILINMWYPAAASPPETSPITHNEYLHIDSNDNRLLALAHTLSAYETGVIAQEIVGAAINELDELQQFALAACLAVTTPCWHYAPPLKERAPLVIYHSGAGSSFEDNAALGEFLASHGYVVIGSPFLNADGSTFNIDAHEGSIRDIDFLINWAAHRPNIDTSRIALVGHSAGAQAILRYATGSNRPHDVLVLLDTTQDYYSMSMPVHESLVRTVSEHANAINTPLLVAAGPEAMFQLCDTLKNSDRTYFTLPDINHNEFIAQGMQRIAAQRILKTMDETEAARTLRVEQLYLKLCETVLAFLDANLRSDHLAFDELVKKYAATTIGGPDPHIERAPVGTTAPPDYARDAEVPPTPRQLAHFLNHHTADELCSLIERFSATTPRSPIYNSNMLMGSLLFDLFKEGRFDEARALYGCFHTFNTDIISIFTFLADIAEMSGRQETARQMLEAAALLEPDNEGVTKRLNEMK